MKIVNILENRQQFKKFRNKNSKVEPAEGPDGDDIDPQGLPGQPLADRSPNRLNEKFYGELSPEFEAPSMQDLSCVWIKKNGLWKLFKCTSSPEEATAVASRMKLSTRFETAVGSNSKPVHYPNGKPVDNAYTQGGQTSPTTFEKTEFPDTAQGAIDLLRNQGINTSGAVARPYESIPGKWIVRHRDGESVVDIMHNQVQNLKEAFFFKKKVKESKKKV